MKYIILTVLLCLGLNVYAQQTSSEEFAVQKTIETLFDGMRAGDSTKVHSVFKDDVRMLSVFKNRKGEELMKAGSLEGFLEAVGTAHDAIWDEKIGKIHIQIDDRLAQVWTAYHFYLGENFSHCGVNSFQLVKEADSWKIIHLVDTRRTKNCIPLDVE